MTDVVFNRDRATERWLERFTSTITWEFVDSIPMNQVDKGASRHNQARREAINQQNLDKVRLEILAGDCDYPVVLRRVRDDKYVILTGNHRDEVYRELGLTEIPAYVVECSDDFFHMMAAAANGIHGMPTDQAQMRIEVVKAAARGMSYPQIATAFTLTESRVGEIVRSERGRAALAEGAPSVQITSPTKLAAIARLDQDDIRTFAEKNVLKDKRTAKELETAAAALGKAKSAKERDNIRHEIVGAWLEADKKSTQPSGGPRERKAKELVRILTKPFDVDLVSAMTSRQQEAVLFALDERITELGLIEKSLQRMTLRSA